MTPMTEDTLVASIFLKEGDTYGDQTTIPRIDQPTGRGGITLATLRACKGPSMAIANLKAMTHDEAAVVVLWKLQQLAKDAKIDLIPSVPLRLQMMDFAYNSGEALAIRWLQRVLRVPRSSVIDLPTLAAVINADGWLVNQALIGARLEMIEDATAAAARGQPGIDKRYEAGLETRALTFSLLEVP
jgi:lysozyme family protein